VGLARSRSERRGDEPRLCRPYSARRGRHGHVAGIPQPQLGAANDTLAAAEQGSWGPIVYVGTQGTVQSFDSEKGSGFIVPDDVPDVFVHSSALKTAGLTPLEAGQRVEFKVTQGLRGPQAEDVRVVAGTQIGSED
jgi:CspA family cold shock protein